jgi:hypothetical protein
VFGNLLELLLIELVQNRVCGRFQSYKAMFPSPPHLLHVPLIRIVDSGTQTTPTSNYTGPSLTETSLHKLANGASTSPPAVQPHTVTLLLKRINVLLESMLSSSVTPPYASK